MPQMPCMVRDYQPGDLQSVAALWFASWGSTGLKFSEGASIASNRKRLEAEMVNGWRLRVADKAGEVLGFCAFTPSNSRLNQLFVSPRFHGAGIGTLLLDDAKTRLPAGFWLWTPRANEAAISFYLSRSLRLTRIEQDGDIEMAILEWP